MGSIGDQVRAMFDQLHEGTLIPGYSFSTIVTVRKMAPGEYDPVAGEREESASEVQGSALVRRYTEEEVAGSGGLIVKGDISLKLRHSVFGEIDENCLILYGEKWLQVVRVDPQEMDGAVYDYGVQARG